MTHTFSSLPICHSALRFRLVGGACKPVGQWCEVGLDVGVMQPSDVDMRGIS